MRGRDMTMRGGAAQPQEKRCASCGFQVLEGRKLPPNYNRGPGSRGFRSNEVPAQDGRNPLNTSLTSGGCDMRTFDLSPLFRSTVGFDRLAEMLDSVAQYDSS